MKLTFCYRHIAPYHHAQLNALVDAGVDVTVITLNDFSFAAFDEYVPSTSKYVYRVLKINDRKWDKLFKMLLQSKPDVVLVPGWGHAYALAVLNWSIRAGLPCIAISDSQQCDQSRSIVLEEVKKRLVKMYSAGFVAGQRSRDYIARLGMPADRITVGCNVVDNAGFSRRAEEVRKESKTLRKSLGVPGRYFLVVNRLIPVKNTSIVIRSFGLFCAENELNEWSLVIVGTGSLKNELQCLVKEMGIEDSVIFVGSVRHADIPVYYALASVFILASRSESWGLVVNEAMSSGLPVLVSENCGSSADLVESGVNGFTFQTDDEKGLARCMSRFVFGELDCLEMGRCSREIINDWSLDRYVANVQRAAEIAFVNPHREFGIFDRMLLTLVMEWFSRKRQIG